MEKTINGNVVRIDTGASEGIYVVVYVSTITQEAKDLAIKTLKLGEVKLEWIED